MIPVTQTKVVVKNSAGDYVVRGNCYAAAIASILEVTIGSVPNVEVLFDVEYGLIWYDVMQKWLNHNGYEIRNNSRFKVYHDPDFGYEEGTRTQMLIDCEGKYYLASGKSTRGVNHICIYRHGQMIHDPHPTREDVTDIFMFEEIVKL